MAYCITAFRRLCSTTWPGSIAKSDSSGAMCERMISIVFLTATVSYRWFVRKGIDKLVVHKPYIEQR